MRLALALFAVASSTGCDVVFDVQPVAADAPVPDDVAVRERYRDAVLADAPAAYLRLGETSATTARDELAILTCNYLGNVAVGEAGAVMGASTSARFALAATEIGTVECGDQFDFAGLAAFSLELWIKPARTTSYKTAIGKYRDPAVAAGYKIHVLDDTLTFARGTSNTVQTLVDFSLPTLDAWTYIVATYDGAIMALYVDGTRKTQKASVVSIPDSSTELLIGAENGADNPSTPFVGAIDEVAIYTRALTATAIKAHYVAATTP